MNQNPAVPAAAPGAAPTGNLDDRPHAPGREVGVRNVCVSDACRRPFVTGGGDPNPHDRREPRVGPSALDWAVISRRANFSGDKMLSLTGRNMVVVGGSRGVGRRIVEEGIRAGANVLAVAG